MNDRQNTVLWIGLILIALNFIIGGWTVWKKIIFTGPAKTPSAPSVPGIPSIPGIPQLPIVPPIPLAASSKNTPPGNQVTNA